LQLNCFNCASDSRWTTRLIESHLLLACDFRIVEIELAKDLAGHDDIKIGSTLAMN